MDLDEEAATARIISFAKDTIREYRRLQKDLGPITFHYTRSKPYFSIGVFPIDGRVHVEGVEFRGKRYRVDISEVRD